jgi:hypothetical protein
MNSAIAGATAAAIAVPILIALFANKAFPAPQREKVAASLEELRPKYQNWEAGLTFLYGACCAVIGFLFWLILQWLGELHTQLLPDADLKITPGPVFWALPAMFLSLAAGVVPAFYAAKMLLGPRFAEYEAYFCLRHEYDIQRLNRYAYWTTCAIAALGIFLGLNWYFLLGKEGLVINPLLGIGDKSYPYSTVKSIQTAPKLIAPNGNIVSQREYLVTFDNGDTWSTNWLPADNMTAEQKRQLVKTISERSGVTVEEIPVFGKHAL